MGWLRFGARATCAGVVWCAWAGVALADEVTVTIERVASIVGCFDEAGFICASPPDFYAVVDIAGTVFTSAVIEDTDEIFPTDWVFTADVASTPVPVTIAIFDSDFFPPDNEADLDHDCVLTDDPADVDDNVHLDLEVTTPCDISGEVTGTCVDQLVTPPDTNCEPDSAEIDFRIDATFDTDGDGLLDSWEVNGIDIDADGDIDFGSPEGVDPLKKNILVEIDFMTDHEPSLSVLFAAAEMFEEAPVDNPDGSTGIDLIWTIGGEIPHVDEIAVCSDEDPSTVDFADLKTEWFGFHEQILTPANVAERELMYHYVIFGHEQVDDTSGKAEVWGNDLVVTLGGSSVLDANGHAVGSDKEQTLAFVHELGHNLGLRHGGPDDTNCKPNYISLMSYTYATSGIPSPGMPLGRLGYSSVELPALDEIALDEVFGVSDGADRVYWSDANGVTRSGRGDEPLDWDGDGAADETGLMVDLNNRSDIPTGCPPSPDELLLGFEDWSQLEFNFREGPNYGECTAALLPPYEPTSAERLALRSCTVDETCEPKLLSFWQDQCSGADDSEIVNFDTYAACVAEMSTFESVVTGDDVCQVLLDGHSALSCDIAEAAYMALLLNRCSERVPLCCLADTTVPFGVPDVFVDDVIERANADLVPAFQTEAGCDAALRELELIGTDTETPCDPDDLFGGWDNGTLAVGNVDTGIPALLATTTLVGITAVTWDPEQAALLVATGLGSDELWRVPVTGDVAGAPELIGTLVYEDRLGGLIPLTELHAMEIAPEIASTFGFTPGDLYAVALDGPVGCDTNCGFFIDKDTAIATPAAQGTATEQLVGLSFDPLTGELWGYDDGPSRLYTLDASLVETLGVSVGRCVPGAVLSVLTASSLAHDCSGRMFTVDTPSATLVEIDPLTGCGTLIGARGSFRGKAMGPVRREGLGLDGDASSR